MEYGFLMDNLAYIKRFCERHERCDKCPLCYDNGACAVVCSGPPEGWNIEDMVQKEENSEL